PGLGRAGGSGKRLRTGDCVSARSEARTARDRRGGQGHQNGAQASRAARLVRKLQSSSPGP
ncbi:MAG: hypothetical protein ACK56I_24125, partial [bacterium]